ncbi:MAG: UPF0182 family protein [Syntrophales bacterium]|jgi:hypothetical protein|nr:UPF0182 family protein [Syntrophales bacterium]
MTPISTSSQQSGQKIGIAVVVAAMVLFLLLTKIISLVTDWLWFQEVGYQTVFSVTILAKLKAGAIFGIIFFLIVYINFRVALRLSEKPLFADPAGGFPLPFRDIEAGALKALLLSGALLLAIFAALNGAAQSENLLLFLNASPFGLSDPLFEKDISFYVFQLPLLLYIKGWLSFILILTIAATGFLYLLRKSFLFIPPRIWRISPAARTHLSLLVAVFFFWGIFGAWLDLNELLFAKRGVVFGPGYTDVTTQVWILKLMMILYALAGLAMLIYAFRPDWRIPAAAVVLLVAVSFLGRGIYPSLVQKFQVIPNEVAAETPYLEKNIRFTRFAYGLDNIEEKEFSTEDSLTAQDIINNNLTIKNIRLWNHGPLLQTYSQLQEMRTYYKFTGVDNDRYTINGEYRQVMLSPREISYKALPSRTWVNEHLTYTHGYGAVMGPVNSISPEGLPDFFIKDIPPVATASIRITRPEIYFGENSNDFVFVKAKAPEFDYPVGDKNVYNRYEGKGGVPLSFFKKVLFAIRFGSATMLLSDDITSASRVLYHRNVLERAAMIAPFARFDDDPYLVISPEGRLLWFIDGYTTTDRFPYSEPIPAIGNYIRNSLKAVVDAYDGTINLYISDPADPILKTYSRIFPGVFKPLSELPAELRSHIRYPAGMMSIQARMYRAYHMQDPRVFYNKEDLWSIPGKQTSGNSKAMDPYYTIMKLPDAAKEEFVLLSPFTPSLKDNMSAWMAARCDEPNYGKVIVYKFPKQKLVYGPSQIEARIDQDAVISQQLSLWHQRGSNVIRGSLLAIPIEKSILYVESLYLSAENGQLPELKRVIVANGNNIAMEETLDAALRKIFGGGAAKDKKASPETTKPGASSDRTYRQLAAEALGHFLKAQELLRQGNWGAFGEELKKTGELLRNLEKK